MDEEAAHKQAEDEVSGTRTQEIACTEQPCNIQEHGMYANVAGGVTRDSGESATALAKSSSAPALNPPPRKTRPFGTRSPFEEEIRCTKPVTDKWGFPKPLPSIPPAEAWNWRHHLLGTSNEGVPKGRRTYFSKPETLAELKEALRSNPSIKNSEGILQRLELGDLPQRPRSFITPDAGAPVCPERHVYGGTMLDRDGMGRTWNGRWHAGIAMINEHCHPDHRTYFTQRSLFERSPSQQYRRFLHQERRPGEWVSIDQRRPAPFGPLGGLLTGRSGAPVPGATP
ncbi:Pxmp2 [Symbiodinium pilosum]|uniref:Pxmp2 protein n=1 Tax=Symbiodinium pilosum TaxID=2952 RepID=A0A812N5W0_SYMPI|nr:Pxmp2 [Symbiodinium pilosum]